MIRRLLRWGLALLLLCGSAWAQDTLPVPALTARVIDQTQTLDTAQRTALEDKLAAFEAQSGPQIVVLMVPTTAPEDIAAYANRVADAWKIGRAQVGDGLLIVVAKDDHRVRIEVARALEGAVPDLAARQIIDQAMVPAFRQGDYAGGLDQAVERVMARLRGEDLPAPDPAQAASPSTGSDLSWGWLVAAAVVVSVLRAVLGPGLASLVAGGAGLAGGWFFQSLMVGVFAGVALAVLTLIGVGNVLQAVLSGSGGGGGGSSGGGFSSGGGGSFGGGGASGSW